MVRRRNADRVLHRGRVVELPVRRRRRTSRVPRIRPRFPRLARARDARHALIWAAIFGVLVFPSAADFVNGYATDTVGCRVVGVVDGDTVGLHCPGQSGILSARVIGYDTPEIFSPQCLGESVRGMVAKWDLRLALWRADRIGVGRRGEDRYGRELVLLTIDGRDVAARMIGAGLARPYDGGRRAGWCG